MAVANQNSAMTLTAPLALFALFAGSLNANSSFKGAWS
jgi:hypothetical protein